MAVLTFVYVVATIVIVFFARKSVKIALALEKNRLRPYVLFNISSSTTSKTRFASIRNLRRRVNSDVRWLSLTHGSGR